MATTQFKDTTFGRAVRTGVQVFITVAPIITGILVLPEVQAFVQQNIGWAFAALVPVIAVVTYLYNVLQTRYGKTG